VEEEFIQVWEMPKSTTRRGKSYEYTKKERVCVYKTTQNEICGKVFSKKAVAHKHLTSHFLKTIGKLLLLIY